MIKYKLKKYNNIYYFAYGANMDTKRLHKRIGKIYNGINGILFNYKLVFNKNTSLNDYAYANIKESKNSKVYGKIYCLTYDELKKIDLDEGIGYERKIFCVKKLDSYEYIYAYAYIATDKQYLTNKLKPSEKYLNYFKNSNLPNEYIESLLNNI
jgi:hypothetical protein